MAGHSHAKNVAIRKAAVAAKRSKIFSKIAKMLMVAARLGGSDVKGNPRLGLAISKAKAVSMPRDTIEKAIKKGAGELDSEGFEEVLYEGYGHGGTAILCEVLTDNRNRTAGEIRRAFDVAGGKLGNTNCVGYLFQRKGQFIIDASHGSEEMLMELVLEAGAEDLKNHGDSFEVLCDPGSFQAVSSALEAKGIQPVSADVVRLPDALAPLDAEGAKKVQRLIDALDDLDDVQNVFSNADLSALDEAPAS
jgi:YebC/PmpR family DNA-binding regulatory protein